ncbi:MAG: diacylglycerol kinase family protein [Clostridiales bacterium]|nr:diacylglycerol kinase family protein [Clostridiales bacterium]
MKYKVLYNPLSGSVVNEKIKDELTELLKEHEFELEDITKVNYAEFLKALKEDENILLVGGDGTINRFVNDTQSYNFKNRVWYYAAGNGNDFWTDIGRKKGDAPICIDKYLENLPTVTVNGKDYKFINGIGYGIDGYCCEMGDKLKSEGKKVDYTGIAVKGLLFHFKPRTATVIVDGQSYNFKKTWIAPSMLGRYYGGGMIPTPSQDRLGDGSLSICLMYNAGKLRTLMAFPKIFKGEHVKKTKQVKILSGREITVKFDKPCALQIDGETVLNVSEYTVRSAVATELPVTEQTAA